MIDKNVNRIKEFRLFSGLSITELCKKLKVDPFDWRKYESEVKSPPLSLLFKMSAYTIKNRLFFTDSKTVGSDHNDIVDSIDLQNNEIKTHLLSLLNSEHKETAQVGREILKSVTDIQNALPSLYQ